MTPGLRKFALTAHVTFSVGWLGAVVAYLAVAIACSVSQDAQMVRSGFSTMELTGWFVIVPLSLAALLTGLVQSLGTEWGLFRYYWILVKCVLTAGAVTILLLHMPVVSHRSGVLAVESDLSLMSAVSDMSDVPKLGKNVVIVADVDHVLHFRIFDRDGRMIVNTDEKRLKGQARQIEELRKQLKNLWPPRELTENEKCEVITAVTSIVVHTVGEVVHAGGGLLVLLATTTLSVYKPWGRTRYWRRKQQERLDTRGGTRMSSPLTLPDTGNEATRDAFPLGLKIFLAIVGVSVTAFVLLHLTGGGPASHGH
jgi:hypothetical protein